MQKFNQSHLFLSVLGLLISQLFLGTTLNAKDLLQAVKLPKKVKLKLKDTEGKVVNLSAYKNKKAIVLAFNGLGCPISELYSQRLEKIHHNYSAKGVVVLGVNANPQDSVKKLSKFKSEFKLSFPILKDAQQTLAQQLQVTRTTEVFVLDPKGNTLYRGAVDDQYSLGKRSVGLRKDRPEKNYLIDALDSALMNRPVLIKTTPAIGCAIHIKKKVTKASTELTYHRDVEPIIQSRCQSCHRPNEIAPFSLLTFNDVDNWAFMIEEVVENRRMPPWHASPKHKNHFSNDRSLTEEERSIILKWIEAGAPRGNPKDAPQPKKFTSGWQIGTPDAVFEMNYANDIPATGTLNYKWARIKTNFNEDKWIQASEVKAGDRSVVHHILVFAVDPKNPRGWQRETRGGAHGYFAIMVPGSEPTIYPKGTAKRLPAGAELILQIHYTTNGKRTKDRSKVGFKFTDKPSRTNIVKTKSAVNQVGLIIPPNAEAHKVYANYRFRRETQLLSLLPHMHLRGQGFKYELLLPHEVDISSQPDYSKLPPQSLSRLKFDQRTKKLSYVGTLPEEVYKKLKEQYTQESDLKNLEKLASQKKTQILLNVPLYDFGWQGSYVFKKPVTAPKGAMLYCTAIFNNSSSNPALTKKQYSKPVFWGNQTWNEMCIGYFDFIEN